MSHPARHPAARVHHVVCRDRSRGPSAGRRRTLALAVVVAAAACGPVGPARAAEGLYLTWNDCYLGASQVSNLAFACNTNAGESELYCAFTMPEAADRVVAVEIVVDLQHSGAALPEWWQLQTNGCRWDPGAMNLTAAANFPGKTACLNMWEGAATPAIAELAGFIPSQPGGAASQARIKVTASVLPPDARTLDGTSMYYAARIVLKHNRTVGDPSCAGCDGAACLVLNSILIGRLAGSPGGDYFLQTPGPGDANWARWQGGGGANCAAVPVRNRAWGQLKGMYRSLP